VSLSGEEQFAYTFDLGSIHLSSDTLKSPLISLPSTDNFYITSAQIAANANVTVDATSYQTVSLCTGAGTCFAFISTAATCILQSAWSDFTLYNSGTSVSGFVVPASCTIYATYQKGGDGHSIFGCNIRLVASAYK